MDAREAVVCRGCRKIFHGMELVVVSQVMHESRDDDALNCNEVRDVMRMLLEVVCVALENGLFLFDCVAVERCSVDLR